MKPVNYIYCKNIKDQITIRQSKVSLLTYTATLSSVLVFSFLPNLQKIARKAMVLAWCRITESGVLLIMFRYRILLIN